MKLLSRKLREILLGGCENKDLIGGTPLIADLSYPYLDENGKEKIKKVKWDGNKGILITMCEKIKELEEELEKELEKIKSLELRNQKFEERVVKIEKKVLRQTGDKIPVSLEE